MGATPPRFVICGIVTFSDIGAVRVIDAAKRLNLKVPGDLSVVGFDDSRPAPPGRSSASASEGTNNTAVAPCFAALANL